MNKDDVSNSLWDISKAIRDLCNAGGDQVVVRWDDCGAVAIVEDSICMTIIRWEPDVGISRVSLFNDHFEALKDSVTRCST